MPELDCIHVSCQLPTNPQQDTADAEENNPIILRRGVCQATTRVPPPGGAARAQACPHIQEGLGSSQGSTSPGISWLPPPLARTFLPIPSTANDYTEKLCQSFLCLREGYLSFPFSKFKNIITKPWALAYIMLCNFS